MGLETIHLSASALSARVGSRNEIAINSALIYLEKAGHIARQQGRDSGIKMIDRAPAGELRVDWNDIAMREAAERPKLREMGNFALSQKRPPPVHPPLFRRPKGGRQLPLLQLPAETEMGRCGAGSTRI